MKHILFLLILIGGFPLTLAADGLAEEALVYEFNVESSEVENCLYGGKALILQNNIGTSLDSYRIHTMIVIDLNQPVMPGNVIERILRFPLTTDEVVIPMDHFAFTLAVYKGPFDEENPDQDLISSGNADLMFVFDGEAVAESSLTIRLTVGE